MSERIAIAVDEDSPAGGQSNTIAGRICNHFGLHGGGFTVDVRGVDTRPAGHPAGRGAPGTSPRGAVRPVLPA